MRSHSGRAAIAPLFFLYGALISGCASDGTKVPVSKQAAPQRYNLTGYSAEFKQGYTDACATPRRRNEARFKSGGDYSMGWNDGRSICKGR
jgi:hypothetical protein